MDYYCSSHFLDATEEDEPGWMPPLFGVLSLPSSLEDDTCQQQTLIEFDQTAVTPQGLPCFNSYEVEPRMDLEEVWKDLNPGSQFAPPASPSSSLNAQLFPSSPPPSSSPLVVTPGLSDTADGEHLPALESSMFLYEFSRDQQPDGTVATIDLLQLSMVNAGAGSREVEAEADRKQASDADARSSLGVSSCAGVTAEGKRRSNSSRRPTSRSTSSTLRSSNPRACKQNWELILKGMQLTNSQSLKGKWYWHLRAEKERLDLENAILGHSGTTSSGAPSAGSSPPQQSVQPALSSTTTTTRTSVGSDNQAEDAASRLLPSRSRLSSLYHWIQTSK